MKHLKIYEQLNRSKKGNTLKLRWVAPRFNPLIDADQWRRYHYRIEVNLGLDLEYSDVLVDFFDVDYDDMALRMLGTGDFVIHRSEPEHPNSRIREIFTRGNIIHIAETQRRLNNGLNGVGDFIMEEIMEHNIEEMGIRFGSHVRINLKPLENATKWGMEWI